MKSRFFPLFSIFHFFQKVKNKKKCKKNILRRFFCGNFFHYNKTVSLILRIFYHIYIPIFNENGCDEHSEAFYAKSGKPLEKIYIISAKNKGFYSEPYFFTLFDTKNLYSKTMYFLHAIKITHNIFFIITYIITNTIT